MANQEKEDNDDESTTVDDSKSASLESQLEPTAAESEPEPEPKPEPEPEPLPETALQKIGRATIIMRDGNEIQRISMVRNLPTLINEDSDECLIKLIPQVQDVLCTGRGAGLELHFETSQAYKDILIMQQQRQRSATPEIAREWSDDDDGASGEDSNHAPAPYAIDLGLCSQILKGIVQNIDAQETIDGLVARSAWLDTLLDVTDHLPLCLIRSRVLPMAVEKAQQANSVQARLMASKLFGRLASKLESSEVKTEIVPLVQSLCQDVDANVRTAVCKQLPSVTRCLQLIELKSLILPLLIEFSKDDDHAVREANLETLAALIDSFDEESCAQVLVPLVEKFIEEVLRDKEVNENNSGQCSEDDAQPIAAKPRHSGGAAAVAKNYGVLCKALKNYLSADQRRWFIERFCEVASLGSEDPISDDSENNNSTNSSFFGSRMDVLSKKNDLPNMMVMCRRYAAYNFPAMVQLAASTSNALVKDMLLPQFKRLCQDSETEVRIQVASVFHEFAKALDGDAPLLIDCFVDLVYSGDPEVISSLAAHLSEILECIYGSSSKSSSNTDDNGNIIQCSSSHTHLSRILLACNRLVRNGSNWRCHSQLLTGFSCLSRFISNDELCQSFIPMIKEEVLNSRALPCRLAALRTLIKWTRDLQSANNLRSITDYLVQSLALNRSCRKRVLYLEACAMAIEYVSKQFFKENLLEPALQLASDPVQNVRLKFCKLLPLFKSALVTSVDTTRLQALENSVKALLNTDNQGYMGEVIRKIINELAHADSVDKVVTATLSNSDENANCKQSLTSSNASESYHSATKLNGDSVMNGLDSNGDVGELSDLNGDHSATADDCESSTRERETSPGKRRDSNGLGGANLTTPARSSSLLVKKTAVVQPRQVINRSPSPRPPLRAVDDPPMPKKESTTLGLSSAKSAADKKSTTTTETDYKSRPPRPSVSSSASSSSSYVPRSSTISDSPSRHNLLSKSASSSSVNALKSDKPVERIVPIRLVGASSSSSSSAYLRPPTPVTYGRRDSRDLPSSRLSSSSLSARNSAASSSSSAIGGSGYQRRNSGDSSCRVRHIPVIRTGTVMKSVERFEPSSLADNDYSDRYGKSAGLGYDRTMNRSFSSFGRTSSDSNNNSSLPRSDSKKDYSYRTEPRSLASPSFTERTRQPYALSRVRSGSALSNGYSSLDRMNRP